MAEIPDVSGRSITDLMSLAGRRAVVTGGGRGLGKAIARRLAEAGADVLVGDVDQTLATQAASDLKASHSSRVLGIFMDVTRTATVVAAADLAVEQLGGIDIWGQ
jgi:NAD(P)-dependent dehydrogenase (short-subunit alcohol dehydrogenase family)